MFSKNALRFKKTLTELSQDSCICKLARRRRNVDDIDHFLTTIMFMLFITHSSDSEISQSSRLQWINTSFDSDCTCLQLEEERGRELGRKLAGREGKKIAESLLDKLSIKKNSVKFLVIFSIYLINNFYEIMPNNAAVICDIQRNYI